MTPKRFSYTTSVIDFDTYETVQQPLLDVLVLNGKLQMPLPMLIDSGGWDTLIHADFAQVLEINLSKCAKRKLAGITGETEGWIHPITIKIPKTKDIFTIDAIFVPKLGTTSILGQKDFFPRYYIKFDKSTNGFYLMKVPTLEFNVNK